MTPTSLLDRLQATLSDRYRIERELGEGGMAVVYLATDLKHARPVALKVLRPELTAVVGADRFLREIQVTAKLQHPHIVPLFDSGVADELLYYVMPVIDGETLRQRLTREGELPVDEGVALIRAVAGALDYAHRHDVVHRDIKPENVLLHDGQPLLADFGIGLAVSAMGDDRLTSTGFSVGTPGYMSPEQMAGERKLDARSDIYALGCVAYEVLAGEPPFTGRTMHAVVSAVMTSDPAPLTERRRAVPEGVGAAIHRSLQRVPADRFATAAQFASALATGSDPQLRAHARTEITAVRRRSSFVMPLVAGVVLGGVAAFALFAARARIGARAVEPTVTRRWDIALPDDAPVALGGAGSSPVGQTSIALSPAGDRLAYVAPRGASTVLMLRDLSGDSSVAIRGTDGAYRPFFSPDGTWIGFFAGNLLRKIPVAGGDPVPVAPVNRISGVNWIADDRILLFQNSGFDFHSISASGARTDSTVHLTTQFGEPDLLPGGEWVVGQLGSGQLALLSITEGTELAITRRGVLALDSVGTSDLLFGTSPKWVPPGHLVYSTADGVLMAMPFDGAGRKVLGEAVPILAGVRMEGGFGYGEYALAHDGTLVYLHGRNQLYS
ncbi:MAG: serine/threonine-protein kinase, partial [Gemmatimonadota bacterium]